MDYYEKEYVTEVKWLQDMWYGLFISISVIGTIANIFIIWIVVAHKTMWTKLNIFICNIAVSDLIVSFGSMPLEGYQHIYQKWIFGSVACTIQEIIETIGICVFVLSLAMIAMERHYAIIPTTKRNDLDIKTMSTLEIWISSIILSAPNWIFATLTKSQNFQNVQCVQIWPDSDEGNSMQQIYTVFFIFLTYILPLVYLIYRYGRLSVNIWVTKKWPTSDENKQTVRMMILVVVLYSATSLPYIVCILFENKCFEIFMAIGDSGINDSFVMWLAMSNAVYNPIIFVCMDKKFRLGFKKAFRWVPGVHYNSNNVLEMGIKPCTNLYLSTEENELNSIK